MADTALSRVMDQAAAAAESFPANNGQALVPANSGGQVAPYQAPTRPSLQSMADSAGIQVDDYLTVKDTGFRLGEMKGLFQEAKVRIDLSEVVPIIQVRANRGGQTTFIKSYDGLMTSQGQNFDQATAHLRATHDKVDGPYQTAEIPATLLENVSDGKVTVKAGTTIGITPAITGVKFFTKFFNELRKAGLDDKVVEAKIVHTPQTNKNGNEWGVVSFELIGEASE